MSGKYLKYIPKTLQEDFIDNRVIPFVVAGFSKNAITPEGASILDWEGLGKKVATYIPNYTYTMLLTHYRCLKVSFQGLSSLSFWQENSMLMISSREKHIEHFAIFILYYLHDKF